MKIGTFLLMAWAIIPWNGYAVNYRAYARAVAEYESGNDNEAIGPVGERSKYQFTEDTWMGLTDRDFIWATGDEDLADEVFREHFERSRRFLIDHRFPVRVETLYLCHYIGPGAMLRGDITKVHREHAQRVTNLYWAIVTILEEGS